MPQKRLRDRLPPDMGATAAITAAVAVVLGIWLVNWVAGAVAMVLLGAGAGAVIARNRLPKSPESRKRTPKERNDE